MMGPGQKLWSNVTGAIGRAFPSIIQYQKLSTNVPSSFTGRFRSYVWDPPLIISQIITLQCVYYTTLGLMMALLLSLRSYNPAMKYIFDSELVQFYGADNQLLMIAHLLNSLMGALALWYIVQRAKQCLDFTCTLHLFHLFLCWIYSGNFPTQFAWWLVQIVCVILMVSLGEYLCFKTDMKDIPLVGAKADV